MYVLTAEAMKRAEERSHERGISWQEMMENAGAECAKHILNKGLGKKTVVLCGAGKNGGDGLVIARLLSQSGARGVFAVLTSGGVRGELCETMLEKMKKYPVDITDARENTDTALYHIATADTLIDAVFGIGFKGELKGNELKLITAANGNKAAYKYAIDMPSGMSADAIESGAFFGADETLTMIAYKCVHAQKPYSLACGKISVMDIGTPLSDCAPFAEDYGVLTHEEALGLMRKRRYDDHKGSLGRVLTVAGSREMVGCAYLCSAAAIEAGAGLVTAAFPEGLYIPLTSRLCESVFLPLAENENGSISHKACEALYKKVEEADSVALGCGMTACSDTRELVRFVLETAKCPVVLDADALNSVAGCTEILKNASCEVIITPHPGEMARLCGTTVSQIEGSRLETARKFASEHGVTVHLKGANSVTASKEGEIILNTTGNSAMARGGSGDVLTGVTAALAAQIKSPFLAAAAAAHFHGHAADLLYAQMGAAAVTPTRLTENLHKAFV